MNDETKPQGDEERPQGWEGENRGFDQQPPAAGGGYGFYGQQNQTTCCPDARTVRSMYQSSTRPVRPPSRPVW